MVDGSGDTYLLRVRPYKNLQNRVDGAVVALFDVSSASKVARETAETIMHSVKEPILMLSGEQKVLRANDAFCNKFAVSRKETEGRSVFELGNGQWNMPALRTLLEEILPERKNFRNFVVEHDFPELGHKKMLLDGSRVDLGRLGGGVVLLVIRDITP